MELGLILDLWDLFAEGVWRTINLVGLALFFGLILAVPIALARAYRHPLLNPPPGLGLHLSVPRHAAPGADLPDI